MLMRLFCFWTGNNQMSYNRSICLKSIAQNCQVKFHLITPLTLSEWVVEPLHPTYPYLSLTHKADYLRCYFMHFHGGGYTDIKLTFDDWRIYFKKLYCSKSIYMCGYAEKSPKDIASHDQNIISSYSNLPGMGKFIFKPVSPITSEWYSQVTNKLDILSELLSRYPGTYHPRAIYGGVHTRNPIYKLRYKYSKYPLKWNDLLGSILHPIAYRYRSNIILDMCYVNTAKYL